MPWNDSLLLESKNRIHQFDHDRQFDTIVSGRITPKIEDMGLGEAKEFRLVVMHIDMNNFKELTRDLSNEEKLRFLNIYHSGLAAVIRDYNGFIEKYIGDGITALFGVGMDENATALCAIDCGLTILTVIEYVMNGYLKSIQLPYFSCSIGLDYGTIWVARTGIKGMNQLTLVGNEVSIAKQLEEFAGDYEMFLGHDVYSRLSDREQSFCHRQGNRNDFLWGNNNKRYPFYKYTAHWNGYEL